VGDSRPTTTDDFREIQLSGKQLVFLFMAATIVSVIIFLCGVLVGRGVRAEKNPDPAAARGTPAPSPTDSLVSAEPPTPTQEGAGELSYHKRLEASQPPAEQLKPERAPAEPVGAAGQGPSQPQPSSPAEAGAYFVQVTALRDGKDADTLVKDLIAKGYPAFKVGPEPGEPVPLFRVRVGTYAERALADAVLSRLEKDGFKPLVRR
jgi:cell division septation protein DedD